MKGLSDFLYTVSDFYIFSADFWLKYANKKYGTVFAKNRKKLKTKGGDKKWRGATENQL